MVDKVEGEQSDFVKLWCDNCKSGCLLSSDLLLFFLESQLITKSLHQMFHGFTWSTLGGFFRCLKFIL